LSMLICKKNISFSFLLIIFTQKVGVAVRL
jgi:hypothetical protein